MLPKVVRHNGAHELFMNTYGRRRRSMVLLYRFHAEGWSIWRASEASETLSGVYKFELVRYVYIYIYIFIT